MVRHGVVLIGLLAACSEKQPDRPPDQPPATPAPAPTAPAPAKPADAAPATKATAPDEPLCATPCLILDTTPLADAAGSYQTMCGKPWPQVPASDCDEYDYQRNCIYAAHGHVFKNKQWKQTFEGQPWYQARPEFKDKDLPANAAANVAELKKRAAACKKEQAVSAADKKRVDAWIDKVVAGKPEFPAVIIGDIDDIPPADLRTIIFGGEPDPARRKRWQLSYREVDEDVARKLPGGKLRAIQVDVTDPVAEAECTDDEGCESGVWLVLVYDEADKLAAIEWMLSACPLVYRIDGERLRYEGELIRNLARPGAEMTRRLRVSEPPCAGTVRYRIREDKRETTWLDQVALDVDGAVLHPIECAGREGAICANDGVRRRLDRGDWIDVSFAIPAGARCRRVAVVGNGHYLPAR